jgi:hypothetical protein
VSPAYDTVTCESNMEVVFEDWVKSIPMHKRNTRPVCMELSGEIEKLLAWGIERGGSIYVVGALIGMYVGKYGGLAECLYGFLKGVRTYAVGMVCRMFSELGQAGVWSYQLWMQRLIATGSLEEAHQGDKELLEWYRMLLKGLPVYNAEVCHMNLRKNVLYGYEADEEDKIDNETLVKVKEELSSIVPGIFKEKKVVSLAYVPFRKEEDLKRVDGVLDCGMRHYCEVKLGEWIKTSVYANVLSEDEIDGDNWKLAVGTGCSLINLEDFILICGLLERMGDVRGFVEVCLWMIVHAADRGIYDVVLDAFKRHEVSFVAFGRGNKIFTTLRVKYVELKEKDGVHVGILGYLIRIAGFGSVTSCSDEQLSGLKEDMKAVSTQSRNVVVYKPSELPMDGDAYSQQSFYKKYSSSQKACRDIYTGMLDELSSYTKLANRFEVRRRMAEYCGILKRLSNTFMSEIVMDVGFGDAGNSWIVSMVVSGAVGIAAVVEGFCLPVLNQFLETKDVWLLGLTDRDA